MKWWWKAKAFYIYLQGQSTVCFAWPDLSIIRLLWIPLSPPMTMTAFTTTTGLTDWLWECWAFWAIIWIVISEKRQVWCWWWWWTFKLEVTSKGHSWMNTISLWLASCSSTLTGKCSWICAYKSKTESCRGWLSPFDSDSSGGRFDSETILDSKQIFDWKKKKWHYFQSLVPIYCVYCDYIFSKLF